MAARKKAPTSTATDTAPADAAAPALSPAPAPAPSPAPVPAPALAPLPAQPVQALTGDGAMARLDAIGVDWLCEQICAGVPQTQMARGLGVGVAALARWIAADVERSARVREARIAAARTFEEMAEQVLRDALDTFELARAKQLAEHYRWKAAKFSPREFGQQLRTDADAPQGGATPVADLTDDQLDAKLAELIAAGAAGPADPAEEPAFGAGAGMAAQGAQAGAAGPAAGAGAA